MKKKKTTKNKNNNSKLKRTNDKYSDSEDTTSYSAKKQIRKQSKKVFTDLKDLPSTSKESLEDVKTVAVPKEGTFILVQFSSNKGKKTYKYVCLTEEICDGKIVVQGLKSYKKNKNVFRIVKRDISIIDLTQIISNLPTPEFEEKENVFVFPSDIAVNEQ